MMNNGLTSAAILQEVSRRLRAYRINYPMTQKQLADRSGVSLRCVQRLENGEDIQVTNLFKILSALDLADQIPALIPDVTVRPSSFLADAKPRRRVRAKSSDATHSTKTFHWGDEK